MIKLIGNYFKINKIHSIYMIFMMCMIFMMFRTYVDEVLQNRRLINYSKLFKNDMYMLDISNIDDTEKLKQDFGDDIAYSYMDILKDNNLNESFVCYHVNEFYNTAISIKKGRLLSYTNNRNEALIFGRKLHIKYDIGDEISLNNKKYKIVGYLDDNGYLLDLFQKNMNNKINIEDISSKALNGGMVITNDYNFYDTQVNKGLSKNLITIVNKYSDDYTNIITMEKIKKNTYELIGERKQFKMLGVIMLLVLLMYSVWSMSVIHSKKCGKLLSIYYINGISKKCYMLFRILTNSAIIVCANCMYIFVYLTNFLKKIFFQSNSMGIWCIYSSLILSFFLIMGTIVCNLFVIKGSALEIMRRCE